MGSSPKSLMASKQIRILLVEDDPGDADLIRVMLKVVSAGRIKLTHVSSLKEALTCLTQAAPDVILLDLNLPDSQGLDSITRIRAAAHAMPIVVLSDLDHDDALGQQTIRKGAQDYLTKRHIDRALLTRTIRHSIERQRLQENFLKLIATSPDGIVVVDQAGLVLFINQAAEKMFSRSSKDLVGELFGFPLINGATTEMSIGRDTVAEMRVVEIEWREGESANLISLHDTTDRKRTAEQLLRQERLAAMGALASIVGHEVRNPLSVIKNSAEFLKIRLRESLDEKVRQHLEILQEEVRNSDKIIDDILGFARLGELTITSVDTNAVIEAVIKTLIVPANINIARKYETNLPPIPVDVSQVRRAFFNIMTNAVDAMGQDGTLTVATKEQGARRKGAGFVEISFQDTGMGIPEENLDKILEPLFTTKSKGTGLGLPACQNIVHAHNGVIEVESALGRGTLVTVKLPNKTTVEGGGLKW